MTGTAIAGDAILVSAVVTIALLELRRRRRRARRRDHEHGQILVELALATPVVLFAALGFLEAGFLVIDKADQDRRTGVLADWAASHPSEALGPPWAAVVAAEGLDDCTVTLATDPDLGLVTVGTRCQYHPVATRGLWDGLPVSSSASAALPAPTPAPTPTIDPTPTPEATPEPEPSAEPSPSP